MRAPGSPASVLCSLGWQAHEWVILFTRHAYSVRSAISQSRIQQAVFRTSYFAGLAVLPFLVACSHSLSHEELQSKYSASISLASETETFLNHRPGHPYSTQFIRGHLSNLQDQAADIDRDLAGASAETNDASSLNSLKTATQDLTQTLADLRAHAPNAPPASSIARLDSIRQRLQADMPR